nr:flavin reductase [Lachnospiraceae bacterium]
MGQNPMNNFSYGLFVLTARDGAKDNGCIINTAMQVAGNPNYIMISVNKNNYTHDMIKKTGAFNLSILSEKATFETFRHFGFQSGKNVEKLVGVEFSRAANGITYLLNETNAYISGKVVSETDLPTHTVFFAQVTQALVLSEEPSVTYSYYHKNIKPAPAKTEKKKGYICTVCGYIYEGEVLPEDFICPLCKHPASDFKPL